MTWFHGSNSPIETFSFDYLGKGNDQLGPGVYFTSSQENAKQYGSHVRQVDLHLKRPMMPYVKTPVKLIKAILGGIPPDVWASQDSTDWDEDPKKALLKVATAMQQENCIQAVAGAALFTYYKTHPKALMDAVSKVYDGFIVPAGSTQHKPNKGTDVQWAVVYDLGVINEGITASLRQAIALLEGNFWDQSLEGWPTDQSVYFENARTVSKRAYDLIKEHEGLRLEAYQVPGDKVTIGFGHTKGVKLGNKITKEQAEILLKLDVQHVVDRIRPMIEVPVSQEQFDSLVSLAFNIGTTAFSKSTLLKKLNEGDTPGAYQEFAKWSKAGKERSKGLLKRRGQEADLFMERDPFYDVG
jgi:lysozyme